MALVTDFKDEKAAASCIAFGENWTALQESYDSMRRSGLRRGTIMLLICDELDCDLSRSESIVNALESFE